MRYLFIYLLSASAFMPLKAQKEWGLNFSVLTHPLEMHNPHLFNLLDPEDITKWPILRSELTFRWFAGDKIFLNFGLPLQFTRLSYPIEFRDTENNSYDSEIVETYINVGLKAGIGLAFKTGRTGRFLIPLGGEIFTTRFSSRYAYLPSPWNKKEDFLVARNFGETLGYGIHIMPQYQFSLNGKKNNPWRFSVSTTGLLMNNEFQKKGTWSFTFGGGIGVCYLLK